MKESDKTKLYKISNRTFLDRVIFDTVVPTGKWKIVVNPLEQKTLFIEIIITGLIWDSKEWISEDVLFTVYDVDGGIWNVDTNNYTEYENECSKV